MRTILVLLALLTISLTVNSQDKHKVLIVTGQSNHNWEVASKKLKTLFDTSTLFESELSISPAQGEDMSDFIPPFSKYEAVALLYNGDEWCDKAKNEFVKYIKEGGSLIVIHESDNSFAEWKEFNEMTGLGGWNGRNEKSGPWVYWQDNKIIRDSLPGNGGMHGQQSEVLVEIRDSNHPITKGLPDQWLHCTDELYSKLRGPAYNMTVIATAYSDLETGGSGRNEPCLMTITYGQGRIFHTVFGHVGNGQSVAMECMGFQHTLLRGTEWAITGEVYQPLPKNFPSKTKTEKMPLIILSSEIN